MSANIQTALQLLFPPRCVACGGFVESDFGLCGPCWRDTPVIGGLVCDACGVPVVGERFENHVHCDDCLQHPRPWTQGRAALLYRATARKLVLGLKHGDRHDIVQPATQWLVHAAKPLLRDDMVVTPVPLHWTRFLKRRYNQSALLAQSLARALGLGYCPDLLQRPKATDILDGLSFQERFDMMERKIVANPKQVQILAGRPVLIVDDVMTTGATLTAASRACLTAGAGEVCILTLARVAKDT